MPAPVLQFKRGNAGVAGTVPALRPGEPAISLNNFDFFIGIDTSVVNNKFFGSHRYWTREDGTNSLNLNLVDRDGTNYIALKSPDSLSGITTYTLPETPIDGNVLTTDANGVLSWTTALDEFAINNLVSGIGTFTNNVAFTTTTDNTLGDENTGAVQLDGGMGIAKNLTVKQNLHVGGYSEFVGVVTFKGGTINLGDEDTDDIVFGGEIKSNLTPTDDATYDVGIEGKRWRNANFSGVGTFASGATVDGIRIGIEQNTVDTSSGDLVLHSATGIVEVENRLNVIGDIQATGNVFIGGTSLTLYSQDVFIQSKDIILGYTTSISPNDDTANHSGVSIASTEGTPLVPFNVSGINTLPDTYKQMMWFKSGTLGFATDAFAFNYGVAIGTTVMADGVRLAVGSGVTVTDNSISALNFYGNFIGDVSGNVSSADQVKTISASDTNAPYHLTFVDSNNGSATNETIYTDAQLLYNPSNNEFTIGTGVGITQFSGSVSTGSSTSSVPTSSAIIDYVTTEVGNIDLEFGLAADSGGPSTLNTSQTLTINGTANEVETSVSGQTITVGLPNDVIVGTSLSAPTIKTATIQHSSGTQAATIDSSGNIVASQNLTINGNLYVSGSTTQVNTDALTVEDRTIDIGFVNGAAPSSATTWDLGVLFNYYSVGSAKKSAVIWEHTDSRFKFASILDSDINGNDNSTPQLTVNTFAPIEIGSLWVNDCAGQSQVISCTGTERLLENITIDAGTF